MFGMVDIRKILVPVDFSAASTKALRYATALAREFDATLLIAHIIEYSPPTAYAFPGETFEIQKHHIEEVRKKLKDMVPEEVRDSLNYRFIVKSGIVSDELVAAMKDEPVELVVMGTHGRRGFKHWVLGSTTEHLLRRVPMPILTVSHTEEDTAPSSLAGGRILYATDLFEGAGKGLDIAYDWARRFAAELTALHVMLPLQLEYGATYLPLDIGKDHKALHKELSDELEQAIPESIRLDSRVRCTVGEGVPYEVILKFAEDWNADLIVIHLHGKSRRERSLIGSTAERIVRGATRPVLSIPILDSAE
jgi:nucleotide-binding universal stress UspA family protein